MAHTPGPWLIRGYNIFTEGCTKTIAAVYDKGDVPLVAAAPELLAALKELRDVASVMARGIAAVDLTDDLVAALRAEGLPEGFGSRADAAIAKAEGK